MKFDELLGEIGEFGPFQKRIYFMVCFTAIVGSYRAMSPVFLLEITNYRCKIPFLENDTYAVQDDNHKQLIERFIPQVSDSYSKCTLYDVHNNSSRADSNTTQYTCDAWVYDKSVIQSSGPTDFNMVCDNEILRSHSNMIDFAGGLFGALVCGPIGDMFGRKKALIGTVVINSLANVAIAQSVNFAMFAVFNFVLGFTGMAMFMLAFVLAMEFVGPSKRTFAGVVIEYFWAAGLFLLTGMAYLIRQWRHLRLALGIPPILFVTYWWLIPESPRWLISRGRTAEANAIIKKIAKSNKATLRDTVMSDLSVEEDVQQTPLWSTCTSPVLVMRSVAVFFNWFAINIVYYGLSLNVGNLSGDIYLNFFISCLMELIGSILCHLLMNKVGRKTILCSSMILGGLTCTSSLFPLIYGNSCKILFHLIAVKMNIYDNMVLVLQQHATEWILIAITMVGKLCAATAFTVMYIFSAELFPTTLRQSAMGACSLFEGIAGMVAPYIADLGILTKGPLQEVLPLIVFGSLTIVAGLMAIVLPEARDQQLPETLQDAIFFGKPTPSQDQYSDVPVSDIT
ncbi:organic cation transporter protein-like [Haliotis rufescens]|uniref:organic cation transporter protein-like n=1 Tax=Haliotis rufescens TaxID=6454 RepID=UPI00201E80E4|nr:organic cation transporter protein-like [Haliotis rufescens]